MLENFKCFYLDLSLIRKSNNYEKQAKSLTNQNFAIKIETIFRPLEIYL